MELADNALAAVEYVGSGSITTMDPEKAGSLRRKYAVAEPTAPPPAITTSALCMPKCSVPNCRHHEKAQARSGIVQGGIAGRHQICGGPRGGGVRADRLRQRQGALRVPVAGARQDHHADARRAGRGEECAPSAGVVVRPSVAEGSPALVLRPCLS